MGPRMLPGGPLLDHIERLHRHQPDRYPGVDGPAVRFARATGLERAAFYRIRQQGVSVYNADRIAVSLGNHPAEIWGDDWWGIEDARSCRNGRRAA